MGGVRGAAMTNPVTPATDEEVERLREQARDSRSVIASHALMLIARIDAERAARERAEARAERAEAKRDQLRSCNEAMRAPMDTLRSIVRMPAEGEGEVVRALVALKAERDRLRAALEAMRVAGDRLHDDLVLYHAAAAVIPEWNRARALLGEVKP